LIKEALTIVWPEKNWELTKLTLWENTAATGATPATPLPGEAVPEQAKVNEAMRTWGQADITKIQKIIKRTTLDPTDDRYLTFEQATQILKSYGLTEAEMDVWIVKPDEL
jgi:hypothetical protein